MPSTHRHSSDGFSLLELMIALVILGVITAQLFVTLTAQQRAHRNELRSLDVQENARHVLDTIIYDTRNAGMLIPREVAVSTSDGDVANPDRLCVSDGSVFTIPAAGTDVVWDNLGDRFPGIRVQAVNSPVDFTVTSLNLTALGALDIDGSAPANDFAIPLGAATRGVILAAADGSRSFCAGLAGTGASSIRIDAIPPAAAAVAPGHLVAPAILYEVVGTNLLRNGIVMSANVEDLQVEFWVDALDLGGAPNPDGTMQEPQEFPIHDLNSMANLDTARIRRVRISVMGIADIDEELVSGSQLHRYTGVANRQPTGVTDARKRKLFRASVLPRNLLNPGAIPGVP